MFEDRKELDKTMAELAKYLRIIDEAKTEADIIKDALKTYMLKNEIDTLSGTEHKAKLVHKVTPTIDRKQLTLDMPDVAEKYLKITESDYVKFA